MSHDKTETETKADVLKAECARVRRVFDNIFFSCRFQFLHHSGPSPVHHVYTITIPLILTQLVKQGLYVFPGRTANEDLFEPATNPLIPGFRSQ